MLSIEPSVSAKRKRNQDTEFWKTLAAGFLSHNILRKRTPVWTRETEFHVFADTFQTCSSLSAAGSSQALSHTTLSFTFHQGFLKYFLFRWLLALASKVAKEHDLQGKQVLNLVLSGFGTMINLFLHLLKWKGLSTEDWSNQSCNTQASAQDQWQHKEARNTQGQTTGRGAWRREEREHANTKPPQYQRPDFPLSLFLSLYTFLQH